MDRGNCSAYPTDIKRLDEGNWNYWVKSLNTGPMEMELQVGTSSSLIDFSLSDIRRVMHSYEVGLIAVACFLYSFHGNLWEGRGLCRI